MDIQAPTQDKEVSQWQQWLQHPEHLRLRRIFFQIHLWIGMVASLYMLLMSVSGSIAVYRNELEIAGSPQSNLFRMTEWLINLHENLLFGMTGRSANGIAAVCFTVLCLTGAVLWWPGVTHWRRSLSVNWRSSFARLNWDLHNALGFWCFPFLMIWGISGIYFAFPDIFNSMIAVLDPSGKSKTSQVGQVVLAWLSNLHFGRFGWFSEALWTVVGLVPAVLSFTGVFMCCHRLLHRTPPLKLKVGE